MTQKTSQEKPMTRRTQSKQVESLANEAAKLSANEETISPNQLSDLVRNLSAQNDALREELQEIQSTVDKTISKSSNELKNEIAQKPLQSMITAFTLGFVVSAMFRR